MWSEGGMLRGKCTYSYNWGLVSCLSPQSLIPFRLLSIYLIYSNNLFSVYARRCFLLHGIGGPDIYQPCAGECVKKSFVSSQALGALQEFKLTNAGPQADLYIWSGAFLLFIYINIINEFHLIWANDKTKLTYLYIFDVYDSIVGCFREVPPRSPPKWQLYPCAGRNPWPGHSPHL